MTEINIEYVICSDCPCLNVDREQGSECNLSRIDPDSDGRYFMKKENCPLSFVQLKDGRIITPKIKYD